MKITLRRANALQGNILEQLKTIDVRTQVSLNEFQDSTTVLNTARIALTDADARRNSLTRALYDIRATVGRANVQSGVSDLLARAAYIDKRIGQVKLLTESTPTLEHDVIVGKLNRLAATGNENSYRYSDTVEVGILAQESISKFKDELLGLRKEKQKLNDQVLELNVRTEIELTADTVAVLEAEKLV